MRASCGRKLESTPPPTEVTDRPASFDDPVQFNFVFVVIAIVGSNLAVKNSRALRDPNRDLTIFDPAVIQFCSPPPRSVASNPRRENVLRTLLAALTFMVKVINFSSLFSARAECSHGSAADKSATQQKSSSVSQERVD